jgi:ankyrin repeat protein
MTIEKKEQAKLDELFIISCELGNTDLVQELIEKGANVNMTKLNGQKPLHRACWNGHIEVVKLLLTNDVDVNVVNKQGYTPLHISCEFDNTEIVKLLKQHIKKMDKMTTEKKVQDKLGVELAQACLEGHLDIVKELLEKGANVLISCVDMFTVFKESLNNL